MRNNAPKTDLKSTLMSSVNDTGGSITKSALGVPALRTPTFHLPAKTHFLLWTVRIETHAKGGIEPPPPLPRSSKVMSDMLCGPPEHILRYRV